MANRIHTQKRSHISVSLQALFQCSKYTAELCCCSKVGILFFSWPPAANISLLLQAAFASFSDAKNDSSKYPGATETLHQQLLQQDSVVLVMHTSVLVMQTSGKITASGR